jgi:hypothetical protein
MIMGFKKNFEKLSLQILLEIFYFLKLYIEVLSKMHIHFSLKEL